MSTPAKVVQFEQAGDVIQAYENMDIPAWGLVQGKNLIFAYEGDSMDEGKQLLEQWLQILKDKTAIYTICLYRGNITEIKQNTSYDRSFNFRLNKPDLYNSVGSFSHSGQSNDLLLSKINALEKKVEQLEAEDPEDDEEEEEEDLIGQINRISQNPIIAGLIGKVLSGSGQQPAPAKLSGIPGDNDQLLSEAISIFKSVDNDFAKNLHAFALVAKKDPDKYFQLIQLIPLL